MRDIVSRRRILNQPVTPQPVVSAEASHNVKKVSVWQKRLTAISNKLNIVIGNVMVERLPEPKPVTIAQKKTRFFTKKIDLKQRYRVSSSHVKSHISRGTQTVIAQRRHLKTPLGKVATLNLLALLALFGYVLYKQPPTSQDVLQRNVGASSEQTLRRYLPVVANASQSEPISQKQIIEHKKNLPLYTWVTPWNINDVLANRDIYQSFSAFWLTLGSDGSTVTPKGDWSSWHSLNSARNANQSAYITISADPNYSFLALTDSTVQQKLIDNLVQTMNEQQASGIDIDFEALGSDNRDLFTAFIRNLSTQLHNQNKLLAVTLESRIANQVPMDWHAIGQLADEVRLMVYDYHSRVTNQPGPISPLGWLKEVVTYASQQIPKEKIVVALGNYGYDWSSPATDQTTWQGVGLSQEQAVALALANKTPVVQSTGIDERGYDIGTAPNFSYTDSSGIAHQVWFEDNQSLTMKLDLLSQYQFKGVIFWSVGIGDQEFWNNQGSN